MVTDRCLGCYIFVKLSNRQFEHAFRQTWGQTEYIVAGRLKDGPTGTDINSALLVLDAGCQRRPGWETPAVGAGPPLHDGYHPQQAPVVADLDHDGDLKVIAATFDDYLRMYDHDRTPRWSHHFVQSETRFASEAMIGDVNGDGWLEILSGSYDPTFSIFRCLRKMDSSRP